jgi:hypothetical protein
LEDPTGALTDILLYHVVAAKAMSTDLSDGQMITTVFGKDVTVKITSEGVYINDAMVTVADIEAENGVVHVIDAVLNPTITNISALENEITFSIYPNPATNFIRINSSAGVDKLSILDISGRVVTQFSNLNLTEAIDISGFRTGMYLVTIESGSSVNTKKLIVR